MQHFISRSLMGTRYTFRQSFHMLFYRYLSRDGFVGNVKKMDSTIVNILEYIRIKNNIATKIISSILLFTTKVKHLHVIYGSRSSHGTVHRTIRN